MDVRFWEWWTFPGITQVRVDPSLTSEEKLALELVKMPSATENFTGLLCLSLEEHLAGYVA